MNNLTCNEIERKESNDLFLYLDVKCKGRERERV